MDWLSESVVGKLVMHILRLNKLDKLYAKVYDDDPEAFLNRLIDVLGVSIEINEEDLKKYPRKDRSSPCPTIRSEVWTESF